MSGLWQYRVLWESRETLELREGFPEWLARAAAETADTTLKPLTGSGTKTPPATCCMECSLR